MKNLLFILCLSFFGGCAKKNMEDYKGEPGVNGANATLTSVSVHVQPGDWSLSGSNYRAILFIDKITQSIADKGTIQVYSTMDGKTRELPVLEGEDYMLFSYTTGQVQLFFGDSHPATPPAAKPPAQTFRIVIHSATN